METWNFQIVKKNILVLLPLLMLFVFGMRDVKIFFFFPETVWDILLKHKKVPAVSLTQLISVD